MFRYLYRRGQFKGLFGGSRGWTAVWAVIFTARMAKKALTREEKVVFTEELQPGQTVVIRHEVPAPKRPNRLKRLNRKRR